jgi:hypothetical protein
MQLVGILIMAVAALVLAFRGRIYRMWRRQGSSADFSKGRAVALWAVAIGWFFLGLLVFAAFVRS